MVCKSQQKVAHILPYENLHEGPMKISSNGDQNPHRINFGHGSEGLSIVQASLSVAFGNEMGLVASNAAINVMFASVNPFAP